MNLQKSTLSKIIFFLALGLIMLSAQASAQDSDQGYDAQQEQQQQQDFSDQELQKFAQAYTQVQNIQQEYSEEMRGMEDKDEAQALQEKYIEKMKGVIEDEGISIRKYNNIISAMNSNEEIRMKVRDMASDGQ